ncbi:hypothetical protein [Clostridium transplantifaecale]|uniref:hypothetical protein n=1 Tax=Clostridium transplantifaecale TaxID=2479838 RepID=UPI000F643C3A|nr:hypothetical protein [Clostridium transplantifaecale]
MSKDRDRHKTEYDLDQLLKESFRMDDKTLLERFQRAQTEIDDSQIPPEPEDGFERLLEKIEPRYTRDSMPEKKFKKIRRLKPIFKVAMVAGVVVMILLATTITAGAKKYFVYRKTVRPSFRSDVVIDNDKNKTDAGRLEEAYNEISEKTGINVIRLDQVPPELIYQKTIINGEMATMIFDYKGNSFDIVQTTKDSENSVNIISDRKFKEKEDVYNKWLNREVEIQKAQRKTGDIEYSSEIIIGNSYYYLTGVMEKEEFAKIVQNVYIEKESQ